MRFYRNYNIGYYIFIGFVIKCWGKICDLLNSWDEISVGLMNKCVLINFGRAGRGNSSVGVDFVFCLFLFLFPAYLEEVVLSRYSFFFIFMETQ